MQKKLLLIDYIKLNLEDIILKFFKKLVVYLFNLLDRFLKVASAGDQCWEFDVGRKWKDANG